jgi:hypothetical protein
MSAGFTEHTKPHEKIAHWSKQIGHLHKNIERESTPDAERSHSRGPHSRATSVDSRKSVHRDKSNKKNKGNKPFKSFKNNIKEMPDSIFGMIPPAAFFPAAMTGISTSYGKFHDMDPEISKQTFYSYEAVTESRIPNAFFVSKSTGKEHNFMYSAYVFDKKHLTQDQMALRDVYKNVQDVAKTTLGYIYYSCVKKYKPKDEDVYKEGFISFLIPFGFSLPPPNGESSDVRFVSWIQANLFDSLTKDEMPDSLSTFYHFFKRRIIATNIPMKTEDAAMDETEIVTLVKQLRQICEGPAKLLRSFAKVKVQNNLANIQTSETFFDKVKKSKTTMYLQIVVPYRSTKSITATNIINFVMRKCIQKVKQTLYMNAMRLDDRLSPASGDETYLKRLWLATSWIMSTEICRELMTSERISLLTDSIFKTYEQVYAADKAWPSKESWETVNSENRGIVLARGLLAEHYVGKTTSAYKHVAYDKNKSDEARSREGTPFNGMDQSSKLRPWDTPEELTPIASW